MSVLPTIRQLCAATMAPMSQIEMTNESETHLNVALALLNQQRRCRRCLVLLVLLIFCMTTASAQTVVVQVINGRNGKSISKVRVYIGFDDLKGRQPLDLRTNSQGEVQFDAKGSKTIQVHSIGEIACGGQPKGAPYRDYAIDDILRTGLVTRNDCGHFNPEPLRGRLLYIVRPATFSEMW